MIQSEVYVSFFPLILLIIKDAFFIGENFSKTDTLLPRFEDLNAFLEYLKENPLTDKNILIKGSRGIQLEKCVDLL